MSELEPARTCSNPTATERIRAMLDDRGVEWRERVWGGKHSVTTFWHARGVRWHYRENRFGDLRLHADGLAPEQAIAATLGATDARPTKEESSVTCHPISCNCSNNCTNGERTETCKVDVLNTGDCAGYECSEYIMHCNGCGHEFGHVLYSEDGDVWMSEPPNFCPNCGRRIVEPTTNDVDAEVEQ